VRPQQRRAARPPPAHGAVQGRGACTAQGGGALPPYGAHAPPPLSAPVRRACSPSSLYSRTARMLLPLLSTPVRRAARLPTDHRSRIARPARLRGAGLLRIRRAAARPACHLRRGSGSRCASVLKMYRSCPLSLILIPPPLSLLSLSVAASALQINRSIYPLSPGHGRARSTCRRRRAGRGTSPAHPDLLHLDLLHLPTQTYFT
jgi:hypothetical protein